MICDSWVHLLAPLCG